MPLTQPKTDLAYLRNEKTKAEQKLRSCQHREKILERQMSELNRRERVHRLCTRAGMLESFLVCPGELTDDQVMELLKIQKLFAISRFPVGIVDWVGLGVIDDVRFQHSNFRHAHF